MLTNDERAALKALADAATPGPWKSDGESVSASPGESDSWTCQLFDKHESFMDNHIANGAFIAAARTAVPALLAEVEQLRALLGGVQ